MTRARDIADVQDNLGGAIAPYVSGKNVLINGGFDIWQRGTSFASALPSNAYGPDRWSIGRGSFGVTLTRQSTGAPAGTQYYVRMTSTANSSYYDLDTYIETANVAPLLGKTVVFSVKVRGNATQASNTGNTMSFGLQKSTTVDAGIGATWVDVAAGFIGSQFIPVGTTSADWLTVSFTATIPNDGTANSLRIISQYNGTGNVNGSIYEVGAAQLEIGNAVTPFARAGGSIGGELALCQRYYYRSTALTGFQTMGSGHATSTTNGLMYAPLPVTMRVLPTSVDFSTLRLSDTYAWDSAVTALILNTTYNSNTVGVVYCTVASGATAGKFTSLQSNGSGYLGFSAEL
jgi:hypothetical protein